MKKIFLILLLLITYITGNTQIPTPNPADGNTYCVNDTKVYGDENIDPLADYVFTITPATPFNLISNGDQIEVTWSNSGVYTIEIEKTIGTCSSTSQAVITVNPVTIPNVINEVLCQGSGTVNLSAIPLGSNPVFSGIGVTNGIFDASGLNPGVYQIDFSSVDINGCPMIGTGSITITQPPISPIIFTN